MMAVTQALLDLLNSGKAVRANLYTIRLATQQEYRFTDADVAIVAAGRVFRHDGPEISGARMRKSRGLEPDQQSLLVKYKPDHTIGGVPWLTAMRSGALDEAEVSIEKAFMADWGAEVHTIEWFRGTVQQSDGGDQEIRLKVECNSARLGQMLPHELFGPGCSRELFDGGCGLNRATYRVDGAVVRGDRAAVETTVQQPLDWFTRGYVVFTSGANAGVRRAVRRHVDVSGRLEFSTPLVFDPAPGDSFMAYPGCDKAKDTCSVKFHNLHRFKATPYPPAPETVL